jgi:hypothetical protein
MVRPFPGRLAIECTFLAGGYALFKMRQRMQGLYGFVECALAIAASWFILDRLSVEVRPELIVGLMASGYILVRGLTNYSEAGDKRLMPRS